MISPMRRLGLKLAGGAIVLAIGAAIIAAQMNVPSCVELSGAQTLDIPVADMARGTVRFFCFRDSAGEKIRFLLARDDDGKIQSAFDGCEQCYKFGKGFAVGHGEVTCRVCGNRYKLNQIHTGKASCVPIRLPIAEAGGRVKVKVSDLESGRAFF
jgi:uncharacterized membrane protein